jgi:hypothetical protein
MKRILSAIILVACAGCFTLSRAQATVSPEKAKNLHRLMELIGSHNLARQMMDGMMASIKGNMQGADKELEAKVFRIYEEELRKVFTVERVEALVFPIYDKHFTDDEIIALIAFYESPLGKKTTSVLPQILSESLVVGEQLGREVQQSALDRIQKEVLPAMKTARPPARGRRPARTNRS